MYTSQEAIDTNDKLIDKGRLFGDDVIVVSNDNAPWRGTVIGFVPMTQAKRLGPVVRNPKGEQLIVFGYVLPYHDAFFRFLAALPDGAAWSFCGEFYAMMQMSYEISTMTSHDVEEMLRQRKEP